MKKGCTCRAIEFDAKKKGCDGEQVPESRDEACGSKSLIPMPHQRGSSAGLINVRGGGKP